MTTARIDARFAALKAEGRAGFVAYAMAGDRTWIQALDSHASIRLGDVVLNLPQRRQEYCHQGERSGVEL